MTLTATEIKALATLNRKGNFYTFTEVVNADGTTRNKCVKTSEAPARKENNNPVMKMAANAKEMTMVEAQDVMEASRQRQMKNIF
jgi:hypothetical protein